MAGMLGPCWGQAGQLSCREVGTGGRGRHRTSGGQPPHPGTEEQVTRNRKARPGHTRWAPEQSVSFRDEE